METKFTKGEWKILQGKSQRDVFESGRLLATAYNNTVSKQNICLEEAIANAKLIAAAPDLLDSCIELFEYYKTECSIPNLEVLKKAQQAIKKATE